MRTQKPSGFALSTRMRCAAAMLNLASWDIHPLVLDIGIPAFAFHRRRIAHTRGADWGRQVRQAGNRRAGALERVRARTLSGRSGSNPWGGVVYGDGKSTTHYHLVMAMG